MSPPPEQAEHPRVDPPKHALEAPLEPWEAALVQGERPEIMRVRRSADQSEDLKNAFDFAPGAEEAPPWSVHPERFPPGCSPATKRRLQSSSASRPARAPARGSRRSGQRTWISQVRFRMGKCSGLASPKSATHTRRASGESSTFSGFRSLCRTLLVRSLRVDVAHPRRNCVEEPQLARQVETAAVEKAAQVELEELEDDVDLVRPLCGTRVP